MPHLAVSAIGRDRPGIVAGMTEVLLAHQANVEDSQMAILRGHFTMTLIVSVPEGASAAGLREGLERTGRELGLEAVSVAEVEDAEPGTRAEPSHIVTVYGVDHPGIVHAVTRALAGAGVNITDLNTRLVSEQGGEDLYAMMLELTLPPDMSPSVLEKLLEPARRDQGVEVTIRELERDEL